VGENKGKEAEGPCLLQLRPSGEHCWGMLWSTFSSFFFVSYFDFWVFVSVVVNIFFVV
jgi:hypothetical protein